MVKLVTKGQLTRVWPNEAGKRKMADLWSLGNINNKEGEGLVCSVPGEGLSPEAERPPRSCQSPEPPCSSLQLLGVTSRAPGTAPATCEG